MGKAGVLQFMGSQRVGHELVNKNNAAPTPQHIDSLLVLQ